MTNRDGVTIALFFLILFLGWRVTVLEKHYEASQHILRGHDSRLEIQMSYIGSNDAATNRLEGRVLANEKDLSGIAVVRQQVEQIILDHERRIHNLEQE